MTTPGEQQVDLQLGALAELLEQEYGALRRADAAAVAGIAARKRELTDSLAGMRLPPALDALARHCHTLNQRNGELLHLQQGMLTRAMRVLSGANATPAVYGARGQTQVEAGRRRIASA